ncbi:MAG: creatininase family protein [Armatimonadetes bacterium]|nr:creatininase family protein [Armatimonadota bacterium]
MGEVVRFAELTSPEVGAWIERGALALVPIGQVEEHGPHLPVNTDLVIAERTAGAAAALVHPDPPVLVLPGVWSGYSASIMQQWPGTIRLRTRVLADMVHDIVASLIGMGLRKVVLLNAHGHHPALLEMVAREIGDETGVAVAVVDVARMAADAVKAHRKSPPGGCIHGCEFETSLMLHFGERVLMDRAPTDARFTYQSENVPGDGFSGSKRAFWSTWAIEPTRSGVYGEPTLATAETGRLIFESMVGNVAGFLQEYGRHENGGPR